MPARGSRLRREARFPTSTTASRPCSPLPRLAEDEDVFINVWDAAMETECTLLNTMR